MIRNTAEARRTPRAAEELNSITEAIIGAAITVHRQLGPGLLESVYETCLAHQLRKLGHKVDRQKSLPIVFDDLRVDNAFRLDLEVDDEVFVEIKATDIKPIHEAQLLTYLRLAKRPVGLLLNFNSVALKQGIRRLVNDFPG